jgi:hypothetical protein
LQFTYPYASIKDVQASGEAFRPQKRTSSTSNHEISSLFPFLWVFFALLDPFLVKLILLLVNFILWLVSMKVADTYQGVGSAHVSEHPARMHRHDQNSCSKDRSLPNINWTKAKRLETKSIKKFARGIADKGRISMGQFKIIVLPNNKARRYQYRCTNLAPPYL